MFAPLSPFGRLTPFTPDMADLFANYAVPSGAQAGIKPVAVWDKGNTIYGLSSGGVLLPTVESGVMLGSHPTNRQLSVAAEAYLLAAKQYTVVCWGRMPATLPGANQNIFSIATGSFDDLELLEMGAVDGHTFSELWIAGGFQASGNFVETYSVNQRVCVAGRRFTNDWQSATNGLTSTADTSAARPTCSWAKLNTSWTNAADTAADTFQFANGGWAIFDVGIDDTGLAAMTAADAWPA